MITRDSIIKKSDDIVETEIDGEVVMMRIETGSYYGLDPTGSDIWKHLNSPTKVSEIIEDLLEEYNVSESQCEKDVIAFLENIKKDKLIIMI